MAPNALTDEMRAILMDAACLTRADLCRVLKISPKTSRRLDRDGTGPRGVRVSPRIMRYPADEVASFLKANGIAVPAELEPHDA